ncbi:MAG: zeta toxin family protein [Thermoleophilia bacterium]
MTLEAGTGPAVSPGIRIVSEGHGVPFSKGLLAQSLTATGLPPDRAYRVAMEVEKRSRDAGELDLVVDRLHELVGQTLGEMEGSDYLARYHKWTRLGAVQKPVIVLIGGATGVGKSTIASQLANRLGIVRLISSDSIRQVMRTFFSEQLMPAIHYSSFNAGSAIRVPVGKNLDPHLIAFVQQMEMVSVGVKAVIDRALEEGTSLVVEGVHLVPGFLDSATWDRAVVLPVTVAVTDSELHMSHFLVRERETDGRRPFTRYVEHFDEIRRIQDFILSRARAEQTLVVDNVDIDQAVATTVDALYELIDLEGEVVLAGGGAE